MTEKYTLIGVDGNAFAVLGYVDRAMRNEGCTKEERDGYCATAMSGDYHNLLAVSVWQLNELNAKRMD